MPRFLITRIRSKKGTISFVNTEKKWLNAGRKKELKGEKYKLPLFAHEPCSQDIVQEGVGNCYFLASMAAIVSKNPEIIKNMMYDNGNEVTVRFYRPNPEDTSTMLPVLVKVPKIIPEKCHAGYTLWVMIMEVAFCIFRQNMQGTKGYGFQEKKDYDKNAVVDLNFIDGGGDVGYTLETFTGRKHEKTTIPELVPFKFLKDKPTEEGIPAALIREAFFDDTANAEFVKTQNELEGLSEEKYKYRKATHTSLGYRKPEATPEEAEKYERIANKEAEWAKQGFEKEFFTFKALDDQVVVSFKETMDQVDSMEDEWAAKNKEVLEKRVLYNRLINIQIPKLKYDLERLKSDDPEYLKTEEELKALTLKKDEVRKYLAEKDPYGDTLHSKYSFPDEAAHMVMAAKKNRAEIIHRDSENLIEWIKNKKNIKLGYTSKQELIDSSKKILSELEKLSLEQAGEVTEAFELLPSILGVFENDGQKIKKVFEIIKSHATKLLQVSLEKIDTVYNEKVITPFTGEYREEALNNYNSIKKYLNEGKTVATATRNFQGESEEKRGDGAKVIGGLVEHHAYSVLDCGEFEYDGKKQLMLKLRNPWGYGVRQYRKDENGNIKSERSNDKTNGDFWIELNDFMNYYGWWYVV